MKAPQYVVNAFSSGPFTGNPAAVCPLSAWPPDRTLLAIANQNALSETAFFLPAEASPTLRWFTPTTEIALCGHATLASGFVVLTRLFQERTRIEFSTKSGVLVVERRGDDFALNLPAIRPSRAAAHRELDAALGRTPAELFDSGHFVIAVFDGEHHVRDMVPDFGLLSKLGKNVVVTSLGEEADFVSRVFAPRSGIPEDPATGSAHCVLVPLWSERLGRERLEARQLSPRGGWLRCRALDDRVELAGACELFSVGEIFFSSET